MTSTASKVLTFEEWADLPESKLHYEIVDGVMYMAPGATYFHQQISQRINLPLSNFIAANGLGEVLIPPLDVLIQREPLRTRQPDILLMSNRRLAVRGAEEAIEIKFLEVPPDLVVEVLSPSETRRILEDKLRDYQRIGVLECWLFSQLAKTAEIVDLTGGEPKTTAVFDGNQTFRSDRLPGFELNLQEVFR